MLVSSFQKTKNNAGRGVFSMCKSEIAKALCERGYYKGEAKHVVDDVFDIILDAIVSGEEVSIQNFGVFGFKMRKGHRARDISTGVVEMRNDYNAPYFRASPALREAVRKSTPKTAEPKPGENSK